MTAFFAPSSSDPRSRSPMSFPFSLSSPYPEVSTYPVTKSLAVIWGFPRPNFQQRACTLLRFDKIEALHQLGITVLECQRSIQNSPNSTPPPPPTRWTAAGRCSVVVHAPCPLRQDFPGLPNIHGPHAAHLSRPAKAHLLYNDFFLTTVSATSVPA